MAIYNGTLVGIVIIGHDILKSDNNILRYILEQCTEIPPGNLRVGHGMHGPWR